MPDIIIQRNVTISRAVQAEAIYEKIQDGQFEMAVCDQIELWPITWFVQGGASFYASSFAGAMDIGFYFDIIDNPADPHTTDPEEYCWNISINGPKAKIRRLWGTGSANGTAFAPVLLTSVPYNDASGDDPAMSGTVTGSITLQGQFNVHLIYGEGYGQEPEIYYAYQHYDNYGPAEGGMSIYYEPISNLSVCWTFCGGESIYATVDALSVEAKAALRTGLGAAGGTISIVDGNMRNTDIRKVGSISAEGVPGALTDLEQTLLDDSGNGEVMARGTLTASTLTLYGARLKQANANTLGMNLWLGGYSPWYNGHCEHLDGTPVAGALFSSWDIYDNTQLAGSTGSDGNVSLRPSWHYAGCLDFGFINADGYLPQAHRKVVTFPPATFQAGEGQ
jgi:hypothetical protein